MSAVAAADGALGVALSARRAQVGAQRIYPRHCSEKWPLRSATPSAGLQLMN